jgi:hypothetical protein
MIQAKYEKHTVFRIKSSMRWVGDIACIGKRPHEKHTEMGRYY